jgi:hypothetical protein
VKKGDKISSTLAIILSRLGIEPFEVQLRLASAYENGEIVSGDVFDIDEERVINQLREAHQYAVNLTVFAGIVNEDTVTLLVTKAEREATALQQMIETKKAAK